MSGKSLTPFLNDALQGLRKNASDQNVALALNAFVHLTVARKNGATASSAFEVLDSGAGVCGGMCLALKGLLEAYGIKCEYAFTRGGHVAHSMVEARYSDNSSGLLDPYHGVAFLDSKSERPVSIYHIRSYLGADEQPCFFVDRTLTEHRPLTLKTVYSRSDMNKRSDYDFTDLFSNIDELGVANSGLISNVGIELTPGIRVGNPNWTSPTDTEARPWSSLSTWRLDDGKYLSWAYLLGQVSVGYNIQHIWRIKGLEVGKSYRILAKVANAYKSSTSGKKPSITLQPIVPFGMAKFVELEEKSFSPKSDYHPNRIGLSIRASKPEMVVLVSAAGDMVLQSIQIDEVAQ